MFDRHTKLLQKERAAAREDAHLFDYLKDEVGFRLAERIFDIKKEFKVGLDLGCGRGHLSKHLTDASLQKLIMSDYSPGLLASASTPHSPGLTVERRHIDEEHSLPFEDGSLDLVLSNLSLNWVNNLPGCLREVHRSLRADGTLLASMFGGDTLYQLRSALLLAEMERQGGVSAHVSPFTKVQDIGALLNQAGFEMLTIDTDDINVGYPSVWELLWDLQGMAESNANVGRCLHLSRDTIMAAAAIYQELYGQEQGVPATFQIIYMIGWKPDPNNVAQPAPRGSGQVSLKDIGRLEELVRERGLQGKIQFMEELDKGDNDPEGSGSNGQDK